LIASGHKTVELRSWSTRYRGPLRVVSGAAKWKGETSYPDGPRGVAICEARLVDVRLATPEDAAAAGIAPPPGWYAWVLDDVRPIEPVPIKAMQRGSFQPFSGS
jgi:hypothetical protein